MYGPSHGVYGPSHGVYGTSHGVYGPSRRTSVWRMTLAWCVRTLAWRVRTLEWRVYGPADGTCRPSHGVYGPSYVTQGYSATSRATVGYALPAVNAPPPPAKITARHCGARLIELLYGRYECGESDGAWTHTLLLRDTTLMQYT